MSNFLSFKLDEANAELSAPAPARLIGGDPQFRTWNLEEAAGGLYAGVWESTPGKWIGTL